MYFTFEVEGEIVLLIPKFFAGSECLPLSTELTQNQHLTYQADWPDYVRCTCEHCLFEMGRDCLGRCRSTGCGEKESLGSEAENLRVCTDILSSQRRQALLGSL